MNIAEIKPSTRDLTQFVSPQASRQNHAIMLRDHSGSALAVSTDQLLKWEESEISACIVDLPTHVPVTQNFLKSLIEHLSCPLIRLADVEDAGHLFESRAAGFDAQITSVAGVSQEKWHDFFTKSQAMNFRIIAHLKNISDWEKIKNFSPRYVFLDESSADISNELPNETWMIAPSLRALKKSAKIIYSAG